MRFQLGYDSIPQPEGIERISMCDGEVIDFPIWAFPRGSCAKYAKMAAQFIFGDMYVVGSPNGDAWNLRRFHETLRLNPEHPVSDVKSFLSSGKIKPGNLVCLHYPESRHSQDLDIGGERIKYSHVEVLLGINSDGVVVTGRQFLEDARTTTLARLFHQGLIPIEIIRPKLKPYLLKD